MEVDVEVAGGVVRGRTEAGQVVVRGVPFASLPVRFGAPAPPTPWDGVREATAFGPPPPQTGVAGVGVEEWLTLNVWSPGLLGARPVIVWLHGGGYLFGHAGLPEHDGATLAREGVVVVTLNYRVGIEGFGWVDGAPPNRGLLDQVAALTWVRDHIEAFGGDPARVTVVGQSAGAGSIAALMVMPLAAGLFRRAVVQSMPGAFVTPALARDVTAACAAELGVRVDELADLDPHLLPPAADAVLASIGERIDRWGLAAAASVPFAPVVDGDVLPSTPWSGLRGDVDLLVGHTRDEQRLLSLLTGRLGTVTADEAVETARLFSPDPDDSCAAYPDPERLVEVVRSDWLFRMPSLLLARAQLDAGGAAHVYELTWSAPGMGGALGACHGLDVPLVLGNLTVGQPALLIGSDVSDAEVVSRRMREAWVAFASNGDPGWPGFAGGEACVFDVETSIEPYPEQHSASLWHQPPAVLDVR